MGIAVRHYKSTRAVPLVFVGGQPEKVERVKKVLPDAVYTNWERIGAALESAISHPPVNPTVPGSMMAGYAGTPLPRKLGIKENSTVCLIEAPDDFEKTLGELPAGVSLTRELVKNPDVVVWFNVKRDAVEDRITRMGEAIYERGRVWIAWPKKQSGIKTDLSQVEVRAIGLANGLVDFKICAIDDTWSGLAFVRRKKSK
jgi:hypothetical protein